MLPLECHQYFGTEHMLLTAYSVIHKYDVICILVTYLDFTVQDNDLLISGFNLIRVDYPNDIKQGGGSIF